MSAFANIKTYVVDGTQSFRVQQGILATELRVFFSTKLEERQLVAGPDYALDAENGFLVVRLIKPLCGFITLARVADPCVSLQKFGVGMLPELNAWADRMASRMGYLEVRLALAEGRPIGSPECEPAALTLARALRMPHAVDDLCPPDDGCYVLMFKNGAPSFVGPRSMAYMPQFIDADKPTYITLKSIRAGAFDRRPKFLSRKVTWVYPRNPARLKAYHLAAAPAEKYIRCSSFDRISRAVICGISGTEVSLYAPLKM